VPSDPPRAPSSRTRRARPRPRIGPSGQALCSWPKCEQPNNPKQALSAYCAAHQRAARTRAQAKSRAAGAQADEIYQVLVDGPGQHTFVEGCYTGPLGIALHAGKAAEIREQYGELLAAIQTARDNTNGFAPRPGMDPDARFVLKQLRGVVAAANALNEVIAPVLYGSPQS
jgi:hypothetical protein